jgi:primosomal replication protein N
MFVRCRSEQQHFRQKRRIAMALPAKVKGYIMDASGVGIVGATVTCAGISAKTVTGGVYLLAVPVSGLQTVTASMAGRTSASMTVSLTAGGTASVPQITLT